MAMVSKAEIQKKAIELKASIVKEDDLDHEK